MPKGKIANPQWIKTVCQYCGKEFDYYRTASTIRKSCYDCIPEGSEHDASLIRRLIKKKAVQYKGGKCAYCGKEYPQIVYDFHHKDPAQKDFNLGNKHSTVKWDIIQKELDKTVLLCANCHRLVHSGDIVLTGEEQ